MIPGPRTVLPALLCAFALSGCLAPTPWWAEALEEWEGASVETLQAAWGPPRRTIVGASGNPVHVYESHTTRDHREEILRDPDSIVTEDRFPPPGQRYDELDCIMFFEVSAGTVVDARYEGAGCQVVPRERARR